MLSAFFNTLFSISETIASRKTFIDHPGRLSDLDLPIGNTPYYVTSNNRLVSCIKLDGTMRFVLRDEHGEITDKVASLIDPFIDDKSTHFAWLHLHQDDDATNVSEVRRCLAPVYSVSEANGYKNGMFLREIESLISESIQRESTYLCIWSSGRGQPLSTPTVPIKVAGVGSQNATRLNRYESLISSHSAKVDAIYSGLRDVGLTVRIINNSEMGGNLAQALDNDANSQFTPRLFGYIKQKNVEGKNVDKRSMLYQPAGRSRIASRSDYSIIMPPKLGFQIFQRQVDYSNGHVIIGDRAYSSINITLPPEGHVVFNKLISMLKENRIPFRVSQYCSANFRTMILSKIVLAGLLKKIGSNGLLHEALLKLKSFLSAGRKLLMFQMTITVWAPKDDLKLLRFREEATIKAINRWGGSQAQKLNSDSLLGLLSTLPPFRSTSVAPAAVAPSEEVLYLAPMFRPSLPFESGSVLFHSLDGKPIPFSPLSSELNHHVYLICGEPGFGKSMLAQVLIGAIAESFDTLPYIAISDVGTGSLGTIRYLHYILPSHLRSKVQYMELNNNSDCAINRFDTLLGMRYPLPEERISIREWLNLAVTEPTDVETDSIKGMESLLNDIIGIAYDRCADTGARSEAKRYSKTCEHDKLWSLRVRPKLDQHNIHVDETVYYWDIVEALFDKKEYRAASLAQRFASPLLDDMISACNSVDIRQSHKMTLSNDYTVVDYVIQRLTNFKSDFSVTQNVTQYDLTETKISAFNLENVVIDSDTAAAKRISALFFGLTVEMQVSVFFIGHSQVRLMPKKYQRYHTLRLQDIMRTKNLYFADEQQYFTGIPAAERIPNSVATRGRKRSIGVILATQLPRYFSQVMRDLATVRFYCGFDDGSLSSVQKDMPINESEMYLLRNKVNGPSKKGANILIQLNHKNGSYSQLVTLKVGVRKLWGLSTKNESSHLREAVITQFNYEQALEILTAVFPSGEVESEVERIKLQLQNPAAEDGLESSVAAIPLTDILQHLIDNTIETGKQIYSDKLKRTVNESH